MKQPMILFNPLDRPVEFMYDHKVFVFKPGEKKILEWDVANHALMFARAPLEVYTGMFEVSGESNVAYDKMPWKQVVALASKRKLFKPGMGKEAVYKALAEADAR